MKYLSLEVKQPTNITIHGRPEDAYNICRWTLSNQITTQLMHNCYVFFFPSLYISLVPIAISIMYMSIGHIRHK